MRRGALGRSRVTFTVLVSTGAALTALAACDQEPESAPLPEDRRLNLVAEATGDTVDVEFPLQAVSTESGNVYVATHGISRRVMKLDSAAGMARLVGRFGEGPGEYSVPLFLAPKADSLLVFDHSGRVSVFGPDGEFERIAFQNPALTGSAGYAMLLRGDTLLVSQHIPSLGEFGLPLHIVSPTGEIVRSFGADDRTVDPAFLMNQWRFVAMESDSSIWSIGPAAYSLELWTMGGVRVRTMELDRSWWVPMERAWMSSDPDPPPSRATALHRDQDADELFVLLHRARDDWQPPGDDGGPPGPHPLTDQLAHIEQVIEVLDPATGELRAAVVNDTGVYFLKFLGNGQLFGVRASPDGLLLPSIWQIRPVDKEQTGSP